MRWTGRLAAVVVVAATALGVAGVPHAAADQASGTLVVQTVPRTAGARVEAEGRVVRTDAQGVARVPVSDFAGLDRQFQILPSRVGTDTRVVVDRVVGTPSQHSAGQPLAVGLLTERRVHWDFVDRGGRAIPPERISLLELRSSAGQTLRLHGPQLHRPLWVVAARTRQTPKGLVVLPVRWSLSRVVVDGAEVVNRGQQVFLPGRTTQWRVELLFYRVQFSGRDLLFGSSTGDGISVVRPDGVETHYPFRDGSALVPALPRGTYQIRVEGSGLAVTRPVNITQDQQMEVDVISASDLVLVGAVVLLFAVSLVLVGRRQHLLRFRRRLTAWLAGAHGPSSLVAVGVLLCMVLLLVVSVPGARAATRAGTGDVGSGRPPAFAYYYIWYQPTSWLRAKKDYPLLGHYASNDPTVIRSHVAMAQAAGLEGFIVSWKGRPDLDESLAALVRVADRRHFKLAVVYEGLTFHRRPLPVVKVTDDLVKLADLYSHNPAFDAFGKPVVILTGSEQYTTQQIRAIVAPVRDRLQVLASAKSVADYRRTAGLLTGDAYYWSSADPRRDFYAQKMREMGAAVHKDGGLWLAPAAAGFDARLIGGTQVIARRGGATLRQSLQVARASRPDALAVISWNEFSENSNIEPSVLVGTSALATLADELGGRVWMPADLPSRRTTEGPAGLTGWGALLTLLLLVAVLNIVLLVRRRRRVASDKPFGELPQTRDDEEHAASDRFERTRP